MPSADSQDYLWIAVGDIHDEPERFAQIPELSQADGIIVTGDLTITGAVRSHATTIDDVVTEISAATVSERGETRADDRTSVAAMEDRKREGYF